MLLNTEADILDPHGLSERPLPANPLHQNGLERLNWEITRRFDVVSILPHRDPVLCLGGAIPAKQDHDWLISRRYLGEESMAVLTHPTVPITVLDEVTSPQQSRLSSPVVRSP